MIVSKAEKNFYRRLVEMYGEYQATYFYKERVGQEPPKLVEKLINLNNLL
jgi:hypothetical protein